MRRIYYCIPFIFFLLSCSNKYEDPRVEDYLRVVEPNTPFVLDSTCNKSWDALYIVRPYSYMEIEETNIDIPRKYQRMFRAQSSRESYCVLIFTRNQKMVSFAKIGRVFADFSYMDAIRYPAGQVFYLNDKRHVEVWDNKNTRKNNALGASK